MEIRLHVQRWKLDRAADPDEDATALIHGLLELDGKFVDNGKVTVETEGAGILKVTAELLPHSFQVIEHDHDTWNELPL